MLAGIFFEGLRFNFLPLLKLLLGLFANISGVQSNQSGTQFFVLLVLVVELSDCSHFVLFTISGVFSNKSGVQSYQPRE